MLPPIQPTSSDPFTQTSKVQKDRISSFVQDLLQGSGNSKNAVKEIAKLSVAELKERSDLDKIEIPVQSLCNKHCKGLGRIKSLFRFTFAAKCKRLNENIQKAKFEAESDLNILIGHWSGNDKIRIREAVKKIPKEHRDNLVLQTKNLVRGTEDATRMLETLSVVQNLRQEERNQIIDQTKYLLDRIKGDFDPVDLLTMLKAIPKTQREKIFNQTKVVFDRESIDIYSKQIDGKKIIDLITALHALELSEVPYFYGSIADCIIVHAAVKKEAADSLTQAEIMEFSKFAVAFIPQAERAAVIRDTQALMKGMDTQHAIYEIGKIIKIIGSIPKEEREEFLKQAKFVTDGTTLRREKLLKALSKIPKNERSDLIKQALPMMKDMKVGLHRAKILEIAYHVPKEERTFFQHTIPLFAGINEEHRNIVLNKIFSIPEDIRVDVLRQAIPFIEEGERYGNQLVDERCELLDLLCSIPSPERASLIEKARFLIEASLYHKINILTSIHSIPPEQREDVINHVQSLVQDGVVDSSYELLDVVGSIPLEERADVIQHAKSLMQSDQSPYEKIEILSLIQTIPREQRANFVAASAILIENIPGSQIYNLIMYASELTSEELNHIVQRIDQFPAVERLRAIRTYLGHAVPIFNPSDPRYRLRIQRYELTSSPLKVLHDLNAHFQRATKAKLSVEFIDEPGVDASGLSREFVSLLFEGIKSALKFKQNNNGLYRPLSAELTDKDQEAYNEVGKLMMFCLNAEINYPIGMIFDQPVFIALKSLLQNPKLDSKDFSFEDLFAIYAEMNSSNAEDRKQIAFMRQYLAPLNTETSHETLRGLFSVVENEEGIEKLGIDYDIEKIKQHYPVLQKVLRQYIDKTMLQPSIKPLIEIAGGMKSAPFKTLSWTTVKDMTATDISEKLQGVVGKDAVLNSLEFQNVAPDKQEWMKDWVRAADDNKLKQFLFALTGSHALGKTNLKISNRGENIYFHTCFNLVDIPFSYINKKEDFVTVVESAIDSQGGYSRA